MQWILQSYEDTSNLGIALERFGVKHSFHKVIPFVGELTPEPVIDDPSSVLLFGSYSLRHYARKHSLTPGVFTLEPFYNQTAWHPHLLNGPHNSSLNTVRQLASIPPSSVLRFVRPLEDSKEIAGAVMDDAQIEYMCKAVVALEPEYLIKGSLSHDTVMIVSTPSLIFQEWRVWVVNGKVVTYSLYKSGSKVLYRDTIDDDALEFVRQMVDINPGYSDAYVIDICRSEYGLKVLETNCINAAGLYAADLNALVGAFEQF